MEEVKAAIKVMKSGKAGGADGVTAEMLMAEETETPCLLLCIFREIWESEKSSRTSACAGFSVYTGPRQSQTMSCAEEQEQNQSHSKSGERDGNGLVMCYACHQQHYHEFPSGGPLMALEREADRKKHGGGQWTKR